MRSNPSDFELVAPGSLKQVLDLLANEPGIWTPLAGGTELMVALSAGRLSQHRLVSLWNLPELRYICEQEETLVLGSGITFREIRQNACIRQEFPLLAKAASWIGSIANQSRATLGGNIVNASPAADSSPALLVYDAQVELVSTAGSRILPYSEFHLRYKKTQLRSEELVASIRLPRVFQGYAQYLRKVGTRRAQAISKIALAGIAKSEGGILTDIRLAAASLRDVPLRLRATEAALRGKAPQAEQIQAAQAALLEEARPIDDIRSTADYRLRVACNLLEEFLLRLQTGGSRA